MALKVSEKGNVEDLNVRVQWLLDEFKAYFIAWVADGATATNQQTIINKLDVLISEVSGALRPIELVEATASGSTISGVHSLSLLFDGRNGTLDGISVPDGYVASYSPNGNSDTLGSIPFTVPTTKGQRVLITYVKVS